MKRILYILPLLSLLFVSCEDMFHKMITYEGREDPAVLCINAEIVVGKPLKVYVTRSWFFLDENRYVGNPNNGITRRGIVSDATVEMQINDGEWKPLTFVFVDDSIGHFYYYEGSSYYTCDTTFHAGDKVSIRANHPDFKEVSSTEVVPVQPKFSVTQGEQKGLVFPFTVTMDALPTKNDEVIFFYLLGYGHIVDTTTQYITIGYGYSGSYYEKSDTFTIASTSQVLFSRIYSEDFIFSEFNIPRTNHGFYTQNGPLYTTANHFSDARQVTLLLDCDKELMRSDYTADTLDIIAEENRQFHRSVYLDSLVVDVRLANDTYYWYRTTLFANQGSSSYAPEISLYGDDGDDGGYGDIFGELSEIFSELGVQEGTQIYTNIEGGFGHFCFLNHSSATVPCNIKISE